MGSKHASIHLRCDDYSSVLTKLKKEFKMNSGITEKDRVAMEIVRAFANKNISEIENPHEKKEKERILAEIMEQAEADMGSRPPATIVVRKHFVSIYWYDRIRSENLQRETLDYSAKYKLPVLGVAVYDDTNFQIYAVRDIGTSQAKGCRGEYMFDYDDIRAVKAQDICEIIETPFYRDALEKTLDCNDGESMALQFEKGTGLLVFMDDEMCKAAGMSILYKLEGATVFVDNNILWSKT